MSRECPNCGGMRIAGITHQCPPLSREQLRSIIREELQKAMTDLQNMLKPAAAQETESAGEIDGR